MKKTFLPGVAVVMALAGPLQAEPVTWTGAVGVTVSGNSLTRGAAAAAWNAGAASVQVIRDGYGFVEFTATETNTLRMCGLGWGDANQSFTDIEFAIFLNSGALEVYESAYPKGTFGTYATGDRFRVEIAHGVVRYLRNGTVFYTSTSAPSFPLRADTAFYTPGATLSDVRVGNVVWSGPTGISVVDRTLTATGATGWNSGAASANLIAGGDGYVEFTAGQNTTSRAAGLANGNSGTTLTDIEYAVHLRADGIASVVESGTAQGDFGGYVGSDRFRVEVSGGAVRYLKNGSLFYTSTVAPTYPLRADTALETTGAVLQDLLVESLVWSSEIGVATNGASLVKTAATGWNAGAASTNTIATGDGWVEFTAIETNTRRVLGLESGPASTTWSDIDFAIELDEAGQVKVHEGGVLRGTYGTYAHTDLFRIEIHEGVVRYRKNGALLYTSAVAPAYPLHADASLYTTGATLAEVRMGDLVWLNEQNVAVRGALLRKSDATTGWGQSGAVSTRAITSGYVEFVASATNHARMLGLSHGDTNASYSDIDYAIYLMDTGNIKVWEGNSNDRGTFGTYAPGDRLRVEVQGGVVRYRKNDTLLYTSAVAPTLPLRVDVALYTVGSTFVDEVHLGTAVQDQLEPPSFSPAPTTYSTAQTVSISAFPGATIRYTTNGTEPDESSPVYTTGIPVNTQTTLKARAFKPGYLASGTGTATYSFAYGWLDPPTHTPGGGTYIGSVEVSLSAVAGATIRYTTDGNEPSATSPIYTGPITVTTTTTLRARAFKVDWYPSYPITYAVYTIKVATPIIGQPSGSYAAGTPITVTLPTPGAIGGFTTNGTDPSASGPSGVGVASGGTVIAGNYTLKVRSYKTGCTPSDLATATYSVTGSLTPGSVTAGGGHSLVALPDGQVWGWGASAYAQTGSGVSTMAHPLPVVGNGLTGIVKVSGGDNFTLALRSDGRFYVFGGGQYGQLGLGDPPGISYTPTLHPLTNVTDIATGERHALALRSDGTVWAWGVNANGQLGFGPEPAPPPATPQVNTPGQVEGLEGRTIVSIAAGRNHSLARDSEGYVWAWGLNSSYQLGDGTNTQRHRPVRVDGLFGIVAIGSGSGSNHSLAVRGGDRAVLAWGSNYYGTLGDGSTTVRATPVKVVGLTGIVAVATNGYISTAVGEGGELWSWGSGGNVGDGSLSGSANRLLPVLLEPGGIRETSPGNGSSSGRALALGNDGVIWSWGAGWIGDGTGTTRYRPVKVTEPGFASKVATPSVTGWAPMLHNAPIQIGLETTYMAGTTIYYTTDGSEPTTGSTLYTAPFWVTQNTSYKAKAFKSGLEPSNSDTFDYQIRAAQPTFTPAPGTYTAPVTLTISSSPGATIRYTTDNTEPTATSSLYTAPLAVTATTTVRAKAFHSSMYESYSSYGTYTLNLPVGGAPSFTPAPGPFVGSVAVTISGPAGATLRYTTDGSDPGVTSTQYTTPLTLTSTTTLKAKSFPSGQAPSATTTGIYTIQLAPPTLTPPGGAVPPGQGVVLGHADPGATIRYAIDGSNPTPTSPGVTPGSTVTIHSALTLKAAAYKAGNDPSAVTSGTYTVSGTATGPGFIAAGSAHSLLAKPDGTVWGWGQNTQGQLGDGSNSNRFSPTPVGGVDGITWLAGASSHSAARKNDGTPWTTGADGSGQLGNGAGPARNTFGVLAKPGGVDVVAVASTYDHTLSLAADGTVWAWGANGYGQLGNGGGGNQAQPVQVSGLTGVQAIAAGRYHSLAVKTDGTVWAWGVNTEGQLGTGNVNPSSVPVQVKKDATTPLTNITAVAAGVSHSLALASDGTVWSWGRNSEGELGSGAISVPRNYAGAVIQLAQVRHIAAGNFYSLAVRQDGTVWAWGAPDNGQLGTGASSNQPTPGQVNGLSGIDKVAAGAHSLALGVDGSVWAWGWNLYGQLGDGTTTSRSTPAKVADANFSFRVGTPQFNPPSGSHATPQNVTITSTTPGATIHYTKTGVDPTQADPSIPSGGTVLVDESLVLKARAYKTDWSPSAVATLPFAMTLSAPTVTPAGGTYNVPQTLTVSHDLPGVVIRYTTDGSPVTPESPILQLSATSSLGGGASAAALLPVNATTTYNFRGFGGPGTNGNWTPSSTTARAMLMKVGTPSLGTSGGVYGAALFVGVGSVTPQAGLYAASGQRRSASSPGATAGLLLGTTGGSGGQGGAALIDHSTTLRSYGRRGVGWYDSDKSGASYFLAKGGLGGATFHLSAHAGFGQYLKMSLPAGAPSGARLRYTTDGTEPTWRSPLYRGPILARPGMSFRARAFASDYTPSPTAAVFNVSPPPGPEGPTSVAEPPTFNPPGGTYASRRTVTLTSATPGAVIKYTTDGTEPTAASPSVPSGGEVIVTRGLPLKARAIASGMDDSPVSRADYRITGAVISGPWDSGNQKQSALALKTDGTLWGWGTNAGGELGNGNGTQQNAPVQVSGLTNVVGMALGQYHGLAVKADGTVWSWGQNSKGQLGDGSIVAHLTPAVVPGLSNIVAVAATLESSFALSATGAVYSWGSDTYGQLGNLEPQAYRATPALVPITEVVDIKAGWHHVLALRRDGTVMAWGYNYYGQLGDGSTTGREVPVLVTGLQGVVSIAASGIQSLASKSDGDEFGQIWAWGAGGNALGDDMQQDQSIPVHVFEGAKAASIHEVMFATYFKPAAGGLSELWATGNLQAHALSPGNVSTSAIPVPIATGNFVGVGGTVWAPTVLRWNGTLMYWGAQTYAAVNGFALGDTAWNDTDHDGDGLRTSQEWDIGTDPWNVDSNGDGITDGHAVGAQLSPFDTDIDLDGLANALERSLGTDAFRADTDGDGHLDGEDAYPLDPTRWEGPPANPGDTTPPLVTLTEPTNATLVSVVPQP